MARKVETCFRNIELNRGVFNKASFKPSMINFIFGKNGSGKTTISRSLADETTTSDWVPGIDRSDVKVMVYNEDFIADNIQSYGNIPGVFTITKQSAEDKAKIDARNADLRKLNSQIGEKEKEIQRIKDTASSTDDLYNREIWSLTEDIRRNKYPDTQKGFKNGMAKFAAELEATEPVEHDMDELDQLYKTVYVEQGQDQQPPSEYILLNTQIIPQSDILAKQIVGLSESPYANFIKKIGALDWVTTGHQKFHQSADGLCPYCRRELPPNFEEELAACYDEEYKKDLESLKRFVSHYQDAIETIKSAIEKNRHNTFETSLKEEYEAACQALLDKLSYTWTTLQLKLESPGTSYAVNDVSKQINDVNVIAKEINEEIREYKAVLADIPGKQKACRDMVFQLMAYICHDTIVQREATRDVEEKNLTGRTSEYTQFVKDRDALREEIRELNKITVNTTAVKDSINALIKSSGFQGFYLREKSGTKYVYELVRDSGDGQPISIARGLSEGERHFIAFLYFYHTVIGSQSDDGRTVPKIVVIDDPVSSLDSESMFIVAALTRELIGICYNNFRMSFSGNQENYIKQFFCLTHNPYFFREVSYNRLGEFECASFFEIKKHKGNSSTVEPCTEKSHEVGGRIINRSPVRNYYDSLWADYKREDKPETLMNIIRQILEYYFIQMCGYKTGNLRRELLDKNEELFVHTNADGTKDRTDYILAAAMISLLDSGADGFNEGLFFDSSSADPDQMREICQRLFELKGQQQHYYMMYGE